MVLPMEWVFVQNEEPTSKEEDQDLRYSCCTDWSCNQNWSGDFCDFYCVLPVQEDPTIYFFLRRMWKNMRKDDIYRILIPQSWWRLQFPCRPIAWGPRLFIWPPKALYFWMNMHHVRYRSLILKKHGVLFLYIFYLKWNHVSNSIYSLWMFCGNW